MRRLNLMGVTKGNLTVIEEKGRKVLCSCICGTIKWVDRINYLAGYTQSCGCLQKLRTSTANKIHGKAGTPIYICWKAMKRRCYNPMHRAYEWYGGKGVKVCDSWLDFQTFYNDMHETYFPGLTLDRIDSSKDYCKDNCRWLTKSENSKGNSHGKALC